MAKYPKQSDIDKLKKIIDLFSDVELFMPKGPGLYIKKLLHKFYFKFVTQRGEGLLKVIGTRVNDNFTKNGKTGYGVFNATVEEGYIKVIIDVPGLTERKFLANFGKYGQNAVGFVNMRLNDLFPGFSGIPKIDSVLTTTHSGDTVTVCLEFPKL